jgi:predicted Zn-dependent peptidase
MTSFESTIYLLELPKADEQRLDTAFFLLREVASEVKFDPEAVDRERGVILSEKRSRENYQLRRIMKNLEFHMPHAKLVTRLPIGTEDVLKTAKAADLSDLYRRYYRPENATLVIVGDVDPKQVIEWAELYFGRIRKRERAEPLRTVEPAQEGERRLVVHAQSQPVLLIGFHKPSALHPDDASFDAVQDVLSGGRTSRLYRSLVQNKKIAAAAGGFPGFPGNKYPNLFLFFAFAAPGSSNEENEKAMLEEIEALQRDLVTDEELSRVKARARADLVSGLESNTGLAAQLALYQVLTGDWRNLVRRIEAIDRVSREDVQRVAKEYFTERNRNVAYLVPETKGESR